MKVDPFTNGVKCLYYNDELYFHAADMVSVIEDSKIPGFEAVAGFFKDMIKSAKEQDENEEVH